MMSERFMLDNQLLGVDFKRKGVVSATTIHRETKKGLLANVCSCLAPSTNRFPHSFLPVSKRSFSACFASNQFRRTTDVLPWLSYILHDNRSRTDYRSRA